MPKDNPQNHLDMVHATLRQLEAYDWPADLRAAIAKAHQSLDVLAAEAKISKEDRRLAALGRVSHSMAASLDLNEVLTQVMDAVIELTGAERGFLMLRDPLSGTFQMQAARSLDRASLEQKDMAFSKTVVDTVIRTAQGVVTTDAQNDPRFSGQTSVVFYALRSVMCAPLITRDNPIGVIYVDNRAQSGIFTPADLDLLQAFAGQAARAIDNAQIYTQTDQALAARLAELETLTQIDRQLNVHLDLGKVLETALAWAVKETGAAQAWIFLTEEDPASLRLVAGPTDTFALSLEDPIVRQCLREVSPQVAAPKDGAPAHLLAAMLYSGKPIGLIVLQSPQAFPRPAIAFADRLASRAASAIQNARLYQAVQDANMAKTKFVSVVTHELRLPMTSIKGYTDLLRQGAVGPVNEMQQNFLNVVRNNVERMSVLVSDLSDISRIESGRLALSLGMVSVGDCVMDTMQSIQPRLNEKQQILQTELPEQPIKVYADANRVVQVLNNLVSNAHKYSPEGAQIQIRVMRMGDVARVEVQDRGYGISPEDQQKLFGQFFRSEDPLVREQQGWGLGLSVTRRLVELMGGQIGVNSVLKEGSTFWFTLPMHAPETGA
jgi:signal transduction histidine kinase